MKKNKKKLNKENKTIIISLIILILIILCLGINQMLINLISETKKICVEKCKGVDNVVSSIRIIQLLILSNVNAT